MTPRWTEVKVGDVSEQVRGVSYAKGDARLTAHDGFLPIVRANNITDVGLVFDDLVFVPEGKVSAKQRLRRHDVVIAASSGSLGVVGKAAAADGSFAGAFGAFCKVLRPKTEYVDGRYFFHFFKTSAYRQRVSALAAGANINNLRNEHLDDLDLPLPPLPEQRRIAAILDKADDLRAKRRSALATLGGLAQSVFVEMFGDPRGPSGRWSSVALGSIADFRSGTSLPDGEPFSGQMAGFLLAKVSDMNVPGNETELRRTALWSEEGGAAAATCPSGSVVIPKRGGAIATNKKRLTVRKTVLDPNLMGIVPDTSRLNARFLFVWFAAFDLAGITSGSSVPQLNKRDLSPLQIALPPISLQDEFSDRLAKLDRVSRLAQQASDRCDDLGASLQRRAFRGEL